MEPNVTTVFDLLLGLSGQINIKWIRSRLNLSESTFRRYKTHGFWGDSLTQSDLRKLYDEAKLTYYNDNDQRFSDELLRLMSVIGITTVSLTATLQREGYDAFIHDFLDRAYKNSEHSRKRSSGLKTAQENPSASEETPAPPPHSTFTAFQRLRFFLPALCLLLLGLLPGLLYALFVWADSHPWIFVLLSITIALSFIFLGCFVDAPLA